MKIAVISTMGGSPWGASEELWAAMLNEALSEGHQVAASVYKWSCTPPEIRKLQQRGAYIQFRPIKNRRVRGLLGSGQPSQIKRFLKMGHDLICISQGGAYDCVHIPGFLEEIYGSQTPYVVLCHSVRTTFPIEVGREKAREFFERAVFVGFMSQNNRKLAERQLACSIRNARVMQNPLKEISEYVPFESFSSNIQMAVVGRLFVFEKGQDILFEALAAEKWKQRNWTLNVYGEGPDAAYLKDLSRYYGITERVKFFGYVSDIREIWSQNQVAIISSLDESVPLVMVEAMLCGRPCVATAVGAVREWLVDEETGFIADAPAAKLLDAALERAWMKRSAWPQMGLKAREDALMKLSKTPARDLLSLILEIVKRAA